MFTGIVTDVGRVRAVRAGHEARIEIETAHQTAGIAHGASIACAGVCLTVVETGPGWFAVVASAETLARTTLGGWRAGTRVNLERALRLGDELGGHLVLGHVDGVAECVSLAPEGESRRAVFAVADDLARFLAVKGSVALDGVSLTVNEVDGRRFAVNIIPHTLAATTLSGLAGGARVNIEMDMLARYLARLVEDRG
ncbi:MAG: riboflavin synthase [Proteobacteria bacterium]|nr:riboflavin synthase [Pseudomonadota bacterium]